MFTPVSDGSLEARGEREQALSSLVGIPFSSQQFTIQAAVNFALAAPADPAATPWRQWGARNIGGRIRDLVQDPRAPATWYAGSGMGGVFRSDDGGDTWAPVGQPRDSFPVGAIALDPSKSGQLFVGTGEPVLMGNGMMGPAGRGFLRYDPTTGAFRNEVGPALTPPPPPPPAPGAANSYARIVMDPIAPGGRCWIASDTGLWRREPGAAPTYLPPTFNAEPLPPPAAPVSDVILISNWDPSQPRTYRLFAGVAGVGIFRGTWDPAKAPPNSWEPVLANFTPALPAVFDRIRLAYCANYPNHVYALFGTATGNPAWNPIAALYHSDDGGSTWKACNEPGITWGGLSPYIWWTMAVGVHPDNPGIVIVGGMNVARSLDFGQTWDVIIDWQFHTGADRAQHGDNHVFAFDSDAPNRLFVANDGGLSVTPDVANANPATARSWRKRSHGLCISQFNDITSHPNYPFMLGGGLQDNAMYLTFGGPSWVLAGEGDGGQMAFEIQNPRQFISPLQSNGNPRFILQATVVSGSAPPPPPPGGPGGFQDIVRTPLPDVGGATNDVIAIQVATPNVPAGLGGLFVQNVVHHPVQANNAMAGRVGDIMFTTDGGANYAAAGIPPLPPAPAIATHQATALAYGPGATAAASDWWVGTTPPAAPSGQLLVGGGGAIAKVWSNVTPPGLGAGEAITSVAVLPGNGNYVACSTASTAAPFQGRVFLSSDHGANWVNVAGAAPNSLPPCPITCLAFDTTRVIPGPQVLFAGTLAGIYVIRNLPSPGAAIPVGFNPVWNTFNGPAAAPLPLTMVNDLELVTLAPRQPGGPPANQESATQIRLYAAMFGRGIFATDITPYPAAIPAGGPPRRMFIRQHVVEDGLGYPRPTATVYNSAPAAPTYALPQLQGDPRLPAVPSPLPVPPPVGALNDLSAIDIRVDNAPFQFFDELPDGVELDEELHTRDLVVGQPNAVYVQVHNAGWDRFTQPVDVHLFFAPGVAAAAVADPPALPDLHDNFWVNFTVEPDLPPPAGALAAGAARWRRAGKKQTIPANRLSGANPAVVRFEWTPPVELGGAFVGLLAVCHNPEDPVPGGLPTVMSQLVRQERHLAFRLVSAPAYVPDVWIRDTAEDTGGPATGAFAGRSPDIIVLQSAEANPAAAFTDLLDTHNGDRIRAGVPQFLYLRVFNRRNVPVDANVDVYWVKPNAATSAADVNAPAFDGSKWLAVKPLGTVSVPVPAKGWAIGSLNWQSGDVPAPDASAGAFNAIGLAALVSTKDGAEPALHPTSVHDPASFWNFFSRSASANRAAFRAVLYGE